MAIGIGTAILGSAVIGVLGGLAQAHQQKQAQKGQENELKRIKEAFDALKPPELDLDIGDPPEIIANTVPPVDYDFSNITPQQFEVVGEYVPEIAPRIAEQAPQLIADTDVGREGLESQQAALSRLQDIAAGGIDPQFAQRMREAQQGAQQAAQSRQESLTQDYARRGLLGSGTQLASEIGAAEGAMQRAGEMSADAATQAYLNQLGALQSSAQLGGQMRGQELDISARNADIANAFNQRTTAAFQKELQDRAAIRNAAAIRNLGVKQGVSDANVRAAQDAERTNVARGDRLAEQVRAQEQQNIDATNQAAISNWANRVKAGDIKAGREQQMFQNKLAKTQGASGQARDMAAVIGQRGQQDAATIGGLGQIAQQGMMAKMDMDEREKDRELERQKWGL